MMFRLALALSISTLLHTQTSFVSSGPMVGYADMRQVRLWVQTTTEATVAIRYADTANPQRWYWTQPARATATTALTAHLYADSVEPGRVYRYEVYVDGRRVERPYPMLFRTPPLWQWRTDPPSIRIALGSCAYINEPVYDRPGTPYGGEYRIFDAIAATQPHLMLWLGDNVYFREPDWGSWVGMVRRYSHDRAIPELQPLLAQCSNVAIWDDHDYGPNDSDRGFVNKRRAREVFDLFWANPASAFDGEGITTALSWGDCDFFLLDDRWWRSPNKRKTGERTILGDKQFEWLIDNLASSTATFKFVCIGGQVLNPVARYETMATYPAERQRLIEAIRREGIANVIFLTGDRHHTELMRYTEGDSVVLYELTVSPLTSSANIYAASEPNTLRLEGTLVTERNFATIDVEGPRTDRRLQIRVYRSDGSLIWERTINQMRR